MSALITRDTDLACRKELEGGESGVSTWFFARDREQRREQAAGIRNCEQVIIIGAG
jgi:hypothetical protein